LDVMVATPWGSPIMNEFASKKTALLLLKRITDPRNPRAFRYGMRIFVRILKGIATAQEAADSDEEDAKPKVVKPDPLGPLEQLPPSVQVLVTYFPKFCDLLNAPLFPQKTTDQTLKSYESFGFDRLAILDTIEALLTLNYLEVQTALLNSTILSIVFGLVFKFPHNTFCHKAVESLIVKLLDQAGQEAQVKLVEKINLTKTLVDSDKLATQAIANQKRPPPFIPYLRRLGYKLHEIGIRSQLLKATVETVQGWQEYIQIVLEERKKIEVASQKTKVEEELQAYQPQLGSEVGDQDSDSDSYEEGRDADDEDLSLSDDQDMDSANDGEDYDADQAEILLTKQEIEAFA